MVTSIDVAAFPQESVNTKVAPAGSTPADRTKLIGTAVIEAEIRGDTEVRATFDSKMVLSSTLQAALQPTLVCTVPSSANVLAVLTEASELSGDDTRSIGLLAPATTTMSV